MRRRGHLGNFAPVHVCQTSCSLQRCFFVLGAFYCFVSDFFATFFYLLLLLSLSLACVTCSISSSSLPPKFVRLPNTTVFYLLACYRVLPLSFLLLSLAVFLDVMLVLLPSPRFDYSPIFIALRYLLFELFSLLFSVSFSSFLFELCLFRNS